MEELSKLLRHMLAALRYRCTKVIEQVPAHYPNLEAGYGVRRPIEILQHISYVLRCAQSVFDSTIKLHKDILSWDEEVQNFYHELAVLDRYLRNGLPNRDRIAEKILQGPLSDAMTHVGQLAMLRRMAGAPVPADNYFNVEIDMKDID